MINFLVKNTDLNDRNFASFRVACKEIAEKVVDYTQSGACLKDKRLFFRKTKQEW